MLLKKCHNYFEIKLKKQRSRSLLVYIRCIMAIWVTVEKAYWEPVKPGLIGTPVCLWLQVVVLFNQGDLIRLRSTLASQPAMNGHLGDTEALRQCPDCVVEIRTIEIEILLVELAPLFQYGIHESDLIHVMQVGESVFKYFTTALSCFTTKDTKVKKIEE